MLRFVACFQVIFAGIVAAASASWNGAPAWGGPAGWNGGGGGPWQGPPAQVVVQNGQVQDTPEVQAEKAKHFSLVSQAAAAAAAAGPDNSQWNNGNSQWNNQWNDNNGQWNGDNSGQWNGDQGGQWSGNQGQWNGNQGQWNGNQGQWNGAPATSWAGNNGWAAGPAKIVVNNGQVQETPEVAAARAQHLAALAQAGAGAHGNPHWG